MAINAYCAPFDLEIALGGAADLLQLSDPNRTGNINDPGVVAIIAEYIESEAAIIRGIIEVKYDAETIAALDAPSLTLLRTINKWRSARTAWIEGGKGQGAPPRVAEKAKEMDGYVDDLKAGRMKLGRVAGGGTAAINQPAKLVDPDPDGTGISRAGFSLGFR